MESAICGSRSRFRYFWRVLIWLKRILVPSQSNQTGVLCGSPFGPIVAMCASAVVSSKLVYSCGITAIVCFLSLLDILGINAVFHTLIIIPDGCNVIKAGHIIT